MKVITEGDLKPVIVDGCVHIAVEGDGPDQLSGSEAKNIAWAARFNYGLPAGGIEIRGAPFQMPGKAKAKTAGYASIFRLTPGLNETPNIK
jgi:hypothetical protein